jgi:drug/metabolite transporter (DMT)-like permease
MKLSENMTGALFMCGSMAGFAFNDAAIKYASAGIGIYQSIFVRGVFAIILIGIIAWRKGVFKAMPSARDSKLIAWRSLWEVGGTLTFLTALFYLPIANITALLQALPLTVTLAAAWFLNESIGWRRGVAIFIGFIGVLLIVQPGTDGFNAYSILGLVCVLFVTARDLVVRQFSKSVSSLFVSFVTALVITIVGGVLTVVYEGWVPMVASEVALLAVAGCLIFAGYFFSVAAMRVGEVSFVTPFRYTVMVWAITLGYFIWGDVPNALTLIGMTIVIGMGLFTFWREASLRKRINRMQVNRAS